MLHMQSHHNDGVPGVGLNKNISALQAKLVRYYCMDQYYYQILCDLIKAEHKANPTIIPPPNNAPNFKLAQLTSTNITQNQPG